MKIEAGKYYNTRQAPHFLKYKVIQVLEITDRKIYYQYKPNVFNSTSSKTHSYFNHPDIIEHKLYNSPLYKAITKWA